MKDVINHNRTFIGVFCFLVFFSFLINSCSESIPTSGGEKMGLNQYLVNSNTQIEVRDLRLATANFETTEIVDNEGKKRREKTAAVWLFFRNQSEHDTTVRMYAGQMIEVNSYKITMLEIGSNSRGRYAKFEIILGVD